MRTRGDLQGKGTGKGRYSTMRREAVQHQKRGGGGGGAGCLGCREHLICHNCRMKMCNKQLNSVDVVGGRMSTDCREPRKRRFCCWLWSSRLSPSSSCSPLSISLCLPRFSAVQNRGAMARAPAGPPPPSPPLRSRRAFEIVVTSTSKKHFKDGRAFLRYIIYDEQNIKLIVKMANENCGTQQVAVDEDAMGMA